MEGIAEVISRGLRHRLEINAAKPRCGNEPFRNVV